MSVILQNQLAIVGNSFLERGIYENSTFYFEKLIYENDDESTRYLLAKSYIGEGKYHKAYFILKELNSAYCRCLHAEVCIKMNKYHEAEKALLTEKFLKMNVISKDIEKEIPSGSYGYYLLGIVNEKLHRPLDATNLYKKSLELDPFMWCSFERLCKLKPDILEIGKYFSEINPKILMFNNNFSNAFSQSHSNGNNNIKNYLTNRHLNINLNINMPFNQENAYFPSNINSNQVNPLKDFSLSPDETGVFARIKNSEKNNKNDLRQNNSNQNNNQSAKTISSNNNNSKNNSGKINVTVNPNSNQNTNPNINNNIANQLQNSQGQQQIPNNSINKNLNMNLFQWPNSNSGNNNPNSDSQYKNNNFSSSGVEKFQITKNEDSEYNSSCLSNANMKYQAEFRVFTENSEPQNQIATPVLNKDRLEEEYSNLNNHQGYNNEKQCNLRPFNFSGSPNPIGQDLNKIICNSDLMKKYNISNNIQSASNGNKGMINNNEMKEKLDGYDGNIKPFNFIINNNNINNKSGLNIFGNEEDMGQIKENESEYNSLNKDDNNSNLNNNFTNGIIPPSNNIFKNINLGGGNNYMNGNINNTNISDYNSLNNFNSNNLNKKKSNIPYMKNSNNLESNKNISFESSNNINANSINNFKSNDTNNSINKNNMNMNSNTNMTYETYKTLNSAVSKETKQFDMLQNYFYNKGYFRDIGQMLKIFAEIYKKLSLYKCQEALNLIDVLPNNHKNSGLILSFIGRAFFELNKYKNSEKFYQESLKIEPFRLEGIDYFSSCLWHLKDQYQLCSLANHVLEMSLFAPETWVVLGNCYSLQKEHEVALKFLGRAIQLDASYAYAYTLCGHEHFANEAFNESKNFYSKAISIDDKHLNAWWGLSNILMKEEDFKQAITFLKKAISINSNSANLSSMLANAYLQNKEVNKAIKTLEDAEKLDPSNHLVKYQKANILYLLGKFDDSLDILLNLQEKVPKEAPIYVLLGNIYKAKGDSKNALHHYNKAIDLDNRDYNSGKAAVEKLMMDSDQLE